MNSPISYSFDSEQTFVVEQYNDSAPFAGFLPGIAGTLGIPLWAFYVNRGQALASFGLRNKDGAFLEFFPADKAYQLTASRGFRTFLKVMENTQTQCHEPFQRGAGEGVRQRLLVSPHEIGVEEIHPGLGLAIRADMFTLPEAKLAGLVRRVRVENTASVAKTVEIVDGLPQVLAYGLNQWTVKFMSRTSEAFVVVDGVAENTPYFCLKVLPSDTPVVEPLTAGNFLVGFLGDPRKSPLAPVLQKGERNQVIVDAEKIFGLADDFSRPERFYADEPVEFSNQVAGNRTPSAFQFVRLDLQPGESRVFYGLYGHAPSRSALQDFLAGLGDVADYFEAKRETNRCLIEQLGQRAVSATAYPLVDAYVKQCHLDNGLRGGFPTAVPGGLHLHLFGRKHGDLERDYNDFLLQASPFSEGNGDFRDMLQNRRLDLFFDPGLDAKNIRYFFNLIQPDGYNPCSLRNSRFSVRNLDDFNDYAERFPGLAAVLAGEFKYGELWTAAKGDAPLIEAVLGAADEVEDAEFDRGYWSDHWTYLVDLLESYAAIFPDRLTALFRDKEYSFFDPSHCVLPRSRKYVMTAAGLRQYGAVAFRKEKQALIEARSQRRYQVRDNNGTGEVVLTTLLGKIVTLVANKLASLDPYGVGIEMDADRPGWCDALNGLPGLLGSSVNETVELKRLVDFVLPVLENQQGDFVLPVELAEFVSGLDALLQHPELAAEVFWRESQGLKEAYRERVFMGFDGAESGLSFAAVRDFLQAVSRYLQAAIAKACTAAGIVTYFTYAAETFREGAGGQVEVTEFRQHALPLFLEGFVHALRVAPPEEVRRLYQAVNQSELFDRKLGMYRLNVPLGDKALELGRIGVFNYGWLENGSIFLHMHYKFVLEMVRRGLLREFYDNIHTLLIPFREVSQYRRSTTENASFLVSSGFAIDTREHGRACVARLSGATVEFLQLWLHLFLGPEPFVVERGRLSFRPVPSLSKEFFRAQENTVSCLAGPEVLPANSAACTVFGKVLLVYVNPRRQDTFGAAAVIPCGYRLYGGDGDVGIVEGASLDGDVAEALRFGLFRRVDVFLGG